jgi:serine/threonine protein kinase
MNPERWQEIDKLLSEALKREPGRRKDFLEQACAGDDELRRDIEQLLSCDRKAGRFMESPALDVAAKVLARRAELGEKVDFIGHTILHYKVLEKIGEGGMGIVYKALDTHLQRPVAIKVLPPEIVGDRERRRRFAQEARAASALNHPNIITIYDIDQSEGADFIAMEYVAGKPLSELIRDKGLPLREVLQYAVQIAGALEKAHGAGIVHRDLKPANIMVTGDGLVKILDFGLAKLTQPAHQTKSTPSLTQPEGIVGTAAYMSPEQAGGKAVDVRSDIFSFGAVLYEMVTGHPAFKGDSNISTMAAVLHDEPETFSRTSSGTSRELARTVARCLKKDPERRFQHMGDVKVALEELEQELAKRERLKPIHVILAAALVILCVGTWAFLRSIRHGSSPTPPKIVPVTTSGGRSPALSPDGNWIAFEWNGEQRDNMDIYVKEVIGTGFNRLTADPEDDLFPTWSPDGRQIAFLRASADRWTLCLISPLGGTARSLLEVGGGRLSWSPDGKAIAFSHNKSPRDPSSIWLLSVDTLEKEQLTAPASGYVGDYSPAFSPDGRYLAFMRILEFSRRALFVVRLPRGEPKLVTDYNSPSDVCWTSDSRELVFTTPLHTGEEAMWRISLNGGVPVRIPVRGECVFQPTVSRDRLAYESKTGNPDLWRLELTGVQALKPPSRPVFSRSSWEVNPCIVRDGSRIAFESNSSGSMEIWTCDADGTGLMKLTDIGATSTGSPNWSPDGRNIAFDSTKSGNNDIYAVSAKGGPVRRITTDAAEEVVPRWSRDGRWIYFGSNRGGSWQIWKVPSAGGQAMQVTREGGMVACESADGYLYFYGYYGLVKNGVWRMPLSGGQETLVLDREIDPHCWDVTERGIYFIDGKAKPVATLCFYDFATRRVGVLAPVHSDPEFQEDGGLSVSSDGRWLLYSGGIHHTDVMMIENFH